MDPLEKLKSDIQYWEAEELDAATRLRYAKQILPGLKGSLKELEKGDKGPGKAGGAVAPKESKAKSPPPAQPGHPTGGAARLRGTAEAQIEQALAVQSPQSSKDLIAFLAEHGSKTFSRGAVDLGLRRLRKVKKVKEVKKQGNERYYALLQGE